MYCCVLVFSWVQHLSLNRSFLFSLFCIDFLQSRLEQIDKAMQRWHRLCCVALSTCYRHECTKSRQLQLMMGTSPCQSTINTTCSTACCAGKCTGRHTCYVRVVAPCTMYVVTCCADSPDFRKAYLLHQHRAAIHCYSKVMQHSQIGDACCPAKSILHSSTKVHCAIS